MIIAVNPNGASNGNGSGSYQPSKTWVSLGEDTWFEGDEQTPGQEKIIDTKALEEELGIDEESKNN